MSLGKIQHTVMTGSEEPDRQEITRLLQQSRSGNRDSGDKLISVVYRDLRKLANRVMSDESPRHTLQPTALVHEVYLRLFGPTGPDSPQQAIDWKDRAHFFAVAGLQMRRILVDHARRKRSVKGGGVKISLDDAPEPSQPPVELDVEALDEALTRLSQKDSAAAKVVELKFFSGLTDRETADAIGISIPKMRRDWAFARAWLLHELQKA